MDDRRSPLAVMHRIRLIGRLVPQYSLWPAVSRPHLPSQSLQSPSKSRGRHRLSSEFGRHCPATSGKPRAIGGVSLRVTLKEPFSPGRGGRAALTVHKDRHGGLRLGCPAPDSRGEAYAGSLYWRNAMGPWLTVNNVVEQNGCTW